MRLGKWSYRRATFVLSDDIHTLKLIGVKMPIRAKEYLEDRVVHEGPIAARWEQLKKDYPDMCNEHQLVGVLCVAEGSLLQGQIGWMEQSETPTIEDGVSIRLRRGSNDNG